MKRPDGLGKDGDDVSGFRETAGRFRFLFLSVVVEIGGTLGGSTASHMWPQQHSRSSLTCRSVMAVFRLCLCLIHLHWSWLACWVEPAGGRWRRGRPHDLQVAAPWTHGHLKAKRQATGGQDGCFGFSWSSLISSAGEEENYSNILEPGSVNLKLGTDSLKVIKGAHQKTFLLCYSLHPVVYTWVLGGRLRLLVEPQRSSNVVSIQVMKQ